jgi:uncharacterized protein YecA (UPF0149 family)
MKDVTKLNLRLPAAVRDEAATLAEAMGLSLNAYIMLAVTNANSYRAGQVAKHARNVSRATARLQQPALSAAAVLVPKVGANQSCPCGSGQKYKRCHGRP